MVIAYIPRAQAYCVNEGRSKRKSISTVIHLKATGIVRPVEGD